MTGSTLAKTLTLLKAALKTNLTVGVADDALYCQMIEVQQEWYASAYDWSVLKDEWDAPVPAGQAGQFTDFPVNDTNGFANTINFDRPLIAYVQFSSKWQELGFGIGVKEYNVWNSSLNETLDPAMKWGFKSGDVSKFEIWPLGSSDQTVRFVGQRKVASLRTAGALDTTKTLDLDDRLISLAVAVDILTGKEDAGVRPVAERLNALWQTIRAAESQETRSFTIGGRANEEKRKIVPILVR